MMDLFDAIRVDPQIDSNSIKSFKQKENTLIRVNSYHYTSGTYDEYDDFVYNKKHHVCIYVDEFEILKKTPKGCWIDFYGKRKFVLDNSIKRFAHGDLASALKSFKKRKDKQIKILEDKLSDAKASRNYIEENFKDILGKK